MPEQPRARILATALTLAIAAVLGGCSSIPRTGPVTMGGVIKDDITNFTEYFPEGPTQGASQTEIMQGFIAAFTGSQNNYEVARSFLSTSIRNSWDPRASVLIRDGLPTITQTATDTAQYSFSSTAVVNENGAYSESNQPVQQTLTFHFVKEGGEWRISEAPPGIVLSSGIFSSIFQQRTLYFLNKAHNRLVPDIRWFPARGTTQTRIVTALLAGPSPWLQGAVATAFPEGTQLAPPKSVTMSSGVAQVDLTSEARKASEADRELMLVQLQSSLSNVTPVTVNISVEDSPMVLQGPGANAPVTNPVVDSRALIYRDGRFGFYSNGTMTGIDGLSDKIAKLKPLAAVVDASHSYAGVLTEAGVARVTTGSAAGVVIDDRPGLIAPSLDNAGFIWSVPAKQPDAIRAYDRNGKVHEVTVNVPAHSEIAALDVSRDGARIALYLNTAAGPRLIVAGISRDDRLAPVSIGEPILDVTAGSGAAIDIAWADAYSVAALSETDALLYVIGGQSTSLGRPTDGVAIAGGNGRTGLRVLGKDGFIQISRGSSWSTTSVEAGFIAKQH